MQAPRVLLRGISVAFGATIALEDVDVDLVPGTRHAVVGENGAGKSTLMRVLFGLLRPTRGQIVVDDAPVAFASPADAIARGIGMVHQHFELIESFTVWENVVLGAEPRVGLCIDQRTARQAVARLANESGLPIDPNARVADLSVAARQRVEILKALGRNARLLILDEPTALLAPAETGQLWAATRRLSARGATIVFITHKLDEVMAHADTITVLHRGRRILSTPASNTTPAALAAAMLPPVPAGLPPGPPSLGGVGPAGRETGVVQATEPREANSSPPKLGGRGGRTGGRGGEIGDGKAAIVLAVRDLVVHGRRGETAVGGVSLDLRGGEILGIAGVDGSGQIELIETLVGLRPAAQGTIVLLGQDVTALTLARRRRGGIGYVPEDRHGRALVLPFSVEENVVLGRQREPAFSTRNGLLRTGAIRDFSCERVAAFDVRGATPGVPVRALSGGNQQKLVLARELGRQPAVLLASQPTRGLDFAAGRFVHDALRAEKNRGAAVLVQSLDLAEVLALSDRVAVMLAGKIVALLARNEATEARVGALMTGARAA